MSSLQDDARIIWDYMHLHHTLKPADAILVLGSHQTAIGEYAAKLYLQGFAPLVIFSGGFGRITGDDFDKPEAEKFADIARGLGVPDEAIVIENKSTNTGDNIKFTADIVQNKGLRLKSIILVQKSSLCPPMKKF